MFAAFANPPPNAVLVWPTHNHTSRCIRPVQTCRHLSQHISMSIPRSTIQSIIITSSYLTGLAPQGLAGHRTRSAERIRIQAFQASQSCSRAGRPEVYVNHDHVQQGALISVSQLLCRIWVSSSQAELAGSSGLERAPRSKHKRQLKRSPTPHTKARRLGFVAAPGQVEARFCKIEPWRFPTIGQSMSYWRSFVLEIIME
jgi:hypothetical protein